MEQRKPTIAPIVNNPYVKLSEEQLMHEYLKANPNRQIIENKYRDLISRPL